MCMHARGTMPACCMVASDRLPRALVNEAALMMLDSRPFGDLGTGDELDRSIEGEGVDDEGDGSPSAAAEGPIIVYVLPLPVCP